MNILLAEDNDMLRESLSLLIGLHGHSATQAENSQVASNYLMNNPVDLVLSDYDMPQMTGGDLCQVVKDGYPKTRFVCMTGDMRNAKDPRLAGCPILIKPVPIDILLATISEK